MSDSNTVRHRKEDPERKKAVEEGKILASRWGTDLTLSERAVDISKPRRNSLESKWGEERRRGTRTSKASSKLW